MFYMVHCPPHILQAYFLRVVFNYSPYELVTPGSYTNLMAVQENQGWKKAGRIVGFVELMWRFHVALINSQISSNWKIAREHYLSIYYDLIPAPWVISTQPARK